MEKAGRMLKEEVDEEDVARVVSKWTGIPVSKMLEATSLSSFRWKTACDSGWWGRTRR